MTLAKRLINLRNKRGLSQYEVAEKLGIKRARYNAWEQEISKPRTDMLNKIADLFEVTPDYLLGFDHNDTNELPDKSKDFREVLMDERLTIDGKPLTQEDKEKLLRVIEAMFWDSKNNKQ